MPTYATTDNLVHIIEQAGLILLFSVCNYHTPVDLEFIPFNIVLPPTHDQCWQGLQVYCALLFMPAQIVLQNLF